MAKVVKCTCEPALGDLIREYGFHVPPPVETARDGAGLARVEELRQTLGRAAGEAYACHFPNLALLLLTLAAIMKIENWNSGATFRKCFVVFEASFQKVTEYLGQQINVVNAGMDRDQHAAEAARSTPVN
jgi:hypothetical protein